MYVSMYQCIYVSICLALSLSLSLHTYMYNYTYVVECRLTRWPPRQNRCSAEAADPHANAHSVCGPRWSYGFTGYTGAPDYRPDPGLDHREHTHRYDNNKNSDNNNSSSSSSNNNDNNPQSAVCAVALRRWLVTDNWGQH